MLLRRVDSIYYPLIYKSFLKSLTSISSIISNSLNTIKVYLANSIYAALHASYKSIFDIILNISSIRYLDIYYINLYNLFLSYLYYFIS